VRINNNNNNNKNQQIDQGAADHFKKSGRIEDFKNLIGSEVNKNLIRSDQKKSIRSDQVLPTPEINSQTFSEKYIDLWMKDPCRTDPENLNDSHARV
jgi:hypothetical protein